MPPPPSDPSSRATRELVEIDVEFISLVEAPANGRPLVLKGAAGLKARVFGLKAGPDELRRAYGIVYPVGDIDSQGDTATAATVMRAADRWMLGDRARQVDRGHSFTQEQAYVAESWIVRAGDPLFPDEAPGAWAVGIQVGDPGLWEQLKAGRLTGLSLAGMVETRDPSGDDPVTKGWLTRFFDSLTKGDGDMTPEQVKKMIDEALPGALAAALKAADEAKPAPAPAAPMLTAEYLDSALTNMRAEVDASIKSLATKGESQGDTAPAIIDDDDTRGIF